MPKQKMPMHKMGNGSMMAGKKHMPGMGMNDRTKKAAPKRKKKY